MGRWLLGVPTDGPDCRVQTPLGAAKPVYEGSVLVGRAWSVGVLSGPQRGA